MHGMSGSQLRGLATHVTDSMLWRMDRDSVSGGVAIGLFAALLPIPLQTLIGVALAVLSRANIAAPLAMVSLTNPITMGPVFYATYQAGRWLLDIQETVPWPALEVDSLVVWAGMVWKPLLLGSVVVGSVSALSAYLLVRLVWSLPSLFRNIRP